MSDQAFPAIANAIKRLTGLHIEPEKYYLFEHRFPEVMKEQGIASYAALLQEIEKGANQKLISRVIEKITTHETRFFRDESIFDALVEQIIPEWKERNIQGGGDGQYPPLKIWSAACSTGQEPYSIAMMLAEFHLQLVRKTQIVATDISEESVARAVQGRYTTFELSRGLPEKFRKKFFSETEGGAQINRTLLPAIDFKTMNLVTEPAPDRFDIIFCRNVAYYFAPDLRLALFQKMKAALKPEGVLVLGSAESLNGILTDYVLREFGLARYYEMNTANVTLFARKKKTE
jgi:chemotaxis protein methyltransferase CheR